MIFNNKDTYKNEIGVYEIKNIQTGKKYIGSTKASFIKRFQFHRWELETGKHKNKHLLRAYNKYNKQFEFNVIKVTSKEETLSLEQQYIDAEGYYNINLKATDFSHLPKEVIIKRTKSFKKTQALSLKYWKQIKSGKLTLEDVPKKYKAMVNDLLTRQAWNKGIKWESTEHLKVPKRKTNKLKQTWKNTSRRQRKELPEIYVYTLDLKFIKKYNCAKDIEEESTQENFHMYLHMKLRFPNGKSGKTPWFLNSSNINKCANGIVKHYKGLIFSYAPLDSDIQSKSDEFGETPSNNRATPSEALQGCKERVTTNLEPLEQ